MTESEQREPGRAEQLIELAHLSMSSERDGDVHTIRLFGELDLAGAPPVQRELERAETTDVTSIVLDLSGLTFMDSTGVRLVVTATARSRADANRLRLVRGPAAVQRVFELSAVADLLPFDDR
jgi:anti-anti-sigma factor